MARPELLHWIILVGAPPRAGWRERIATNAARKRGAAQFHHGTHGTHMNSTVNVLENPHLGVPMATPGKQVAANFHQLYLKTSHSCLKNGTFLCFPGSGIPRQTTSG